MILAVLRAVGRSMWTAAPVGDACDRAPDKPLDVAGIETGDDVGAKGPGSVTFVAGLQAKARHVELTARVGAHLAGRQLLRVRLEGSHRLDRGHALTATRGAAPLGHIARSVATARCACYEDPNGVGVPRPQSATPLGCLRLGRGVPCCQFEPGRASA